MIRILPYEIIQNDNKGRFLEYQYFKELILPCGEGENPNRIRNLPMKYII